MTDTLYLHIGASKTGTSAIQTYMVRERGHIAGRGLWYPLSGTDALASAGRPTGGNAGELARLLLDHHLDDKTVYDRSCRFFENLKVCDHQKVFLSSQWLEQITPDRGEILKKACGNFAQRTEVLYMMRDIADHAIAIYSDKVWREREMRTFSEFITVYQCPFETVFTLYSDLFGPDTMRGFVYDDCKSNLISGMMSQIGIDTHGLAGPERVNRSLSRLELDVARDLQASTQDAGFISRLAAEHAFRTRTFDLDKFEITPQELLALEEAWQPMISRINKTCLRETAKLNSCSDDLVISERHGTVVLDERAQLMVEMLRAAVAVHDDLTGQSRPY